MKRIAITMMGLILALGCSPGVAANASDATAVLFGLLDKGGCKADSLTGKTWTISTSPVDTHGELVMGDTLDFELIGISTGIANRGSIQVTRSGVIWKSEGGWIGQCVRDGTLSQYVISGDVKIDGCLHELAIGRLDHDDSLSNKIEVIFQDSSSAEAGGCEELILLHPGHAHGTNE